MTIQELTIKAIGFAVENEATIDDLLNEDDLPIEELVQYLLNKAMVELTFRDVPATSYLEDSDWDKVQDILDKRYNELKEEYI